MPRLIGVGDVPGCVTGSTSGLSILHSYHATVLRIAIDPQHGEDGQALPCAQAAVAVGDRVHFTICYSNRWPTPTIGAYFRHVLAFYAPYAWAISIGNEQELLQGGAAATGIRYAAVWRAVEPIVARLAPRAIRVAGEISPWGFSFLRRAYAFGLPGAQALSAHAYFARFGFSLSQVVAWVHKTRLPLWITEGLAGPGAWPSAKPGMFARPLSQMVGVAVADAWLI